MTTRLPRLGFRVLGSKTAARRLVDAADAFAAYASCDPRAEVEREVYLSAFAYGDDFRRHLEETGSTKDYAGPCWAPFVWWDIDQPEDIERALNHARAIATCILHRYPKALDDDDLLLFFSGSKGFHIGLATFWKPAPSITFNRAARRFAETIAAAAGASIDAGVYDKVRLFRAPNSKHPKTGLHKRRLSLDELLHLSPERIQQLAREPFPFELPSITATCDQAGADWQAALQAVEQEAETKAERRAAVADGAPRLNRATLAFIRDGAPVNDRHRLLFSAAANLAEFGCSPALAHELLTEAALDSGLPPADVRRQIDCGLTGGAADSSRQEDKPPPAEPSGEGSPAVDLQAQLSAAWSAHTPPEPEPSGLPSSSTPGPAAADDRQQSGADLQAQLAALWASARATPPAVEDDAAFLVAERKAIQAEAGRPEPPSPPAGARFCYQDDRGRACGRKDSVMWCWEGAPRWYHVADFPLP